ncbi:MAG TPA: flagellar basal body P-ring formation chaperone FlgA [Pseudolabrys sp.]|nr:flagellar basal body P-ring formation chaperone FlgA [Pseudolabrys sp.]
MIRIPLIAVLLALAAPAGAQTLASIATPAHPVLKRQAFVTGDIVRIGDLIDNAGIVADDPIFRAPDPGETGAVPAARVAEAVRSHAIIGLDTGGVTEVKVTRLSRPVAASDIQARIVQALAGRYRVGPAAELYIVFDRELTTLHVDPSASDPSVTRLAYDPRSGRFDVLLDASGQALRFTGTALPGVDSVVLTRPIGRGELLKASDLVVQRRPKAEVSPEVVRSLDLAVGFAMRRSLATGQVLAKTDLTKPDLVTRDTDVTLVYQVPGITLTMRGKALESGAEGDTVNVLNAQSKRTVQGTVAGPGRVVVAGQAARLTANLEPSSDSSNAPRERAE